MLAQVLDRFGDVSNFVLTELPQPEVKFGHVLVKIAATSVNPADYKIRRDGPPIAPELPAVLGMDFAGTVAEVGDGVAGFRVGDEVYGCAGGVRGLGGALAEYMLADARLIAQKPKSLSMREAAALPLVSITAWEALYDKANVQPGQTVLIHGATGGVSHVAIQLARIRGAVVYATASSDKKAAVARELGADEVVYYTQEAVEEYVERLTRGRGFDVVFDTIGGANLDVALQGARLNGTVVSIVTMESHDLSIMHVRGLTLHVVFMLIPMLHNVGREHHGFILRSIARYADAGFLKPLIDPRRFTLAETGEAHHYAESGTAIGKVVVQVQGVVPTSV
jgi:NADPH2:quinone reductase